jgi:hypothetical protein
VHTLAAQHKQSPNLDRWLSGDSSRASGRE